MHKINEPISVDFIEKAIIEQQKARRLNVFDFNDKT